MEYQVLIFVTACIPFVIAALVVIAEAVIFINKESKKKVKTIIDILILFIASSCSDKQTYEEKILLPEK